MAVKAVVPFLVAMMLFTGVCNTLLTKYQDLQCVHNCFDLNPSKRHYFEQPVVQTAQMFIGEMGCWLVIFAFSLYKRYQSSRSGGASKDSYFSSRGPTEDDGDDTLSEDPLATSLTLPAGDERAELGGWKVTYLALPAVCDICGTTLMNVGLLFVAASIYQMTRGALVLFVGLFSVWFLKRRLGLYKWFALFVVVTGVAVVGLAGALAEVHQPDRPPTSHTLSISHLRAQLVGDVQVTEVDVAVQTILGVTLIALAQIFTATQFVLEESIMEKYAIEPLKAVGWEGLWGFIVTVIGMVIMHFAYGRTPAGKGGYFDAGEGLWQITHFPKIAYSSVLIMISIGGFNFFGLSVTRTVSATSRSTIDTCRTLFIWIVSLGLGWESFKWLQVAGFALLVYGTFLFNDLVKPPMKACLDGGVEEEDDELLPERA
ncbi:integral membrane protein [Tothia fuscella]|uniref:Integral membrane protein n=1 Tax=Tothia fuscella TaxID=1048955 RepID=A0A9P4TXG2_9PEZI|nr:integral membrane protein [Tothia fuscella]